MPIAVHVGPELGRAVQAIKVVEECNLDTESDIYRAISLEGSIGLDGSAWIIKFGTGGNHDGGVSLLKHSVVKPVTSKLFEVILFRDSGSCLTTIKLLMCDIPGDVPLLVIKYEILEAALPEASNTLEDKVFTP